MKDAKQNQNYNYEVVKQIQTIYDTIKDLWDDVKYDEADKIREVWTDKAGEYYVEKLLETDSLVVKVLDQLEILRDAWIKYLNNPSGKV